MFFLYIIMLDISKIKSLPYLDILTTDTTK